MIFIPGVKGQKWGQRRYQNSDGTWTELGKERRRKGRTKKSTSNPMDVANDIYKKLDSFDYGCIIDGKRYNETNLDEVDWSKYRTMPIDKFEKEKIGVCWDFTNYQHAKLNEAGIDNNTYMIMMDTPDGPITHTFTIFKDSKTGKNYWLEQALYSERGIREVKNYKDAVNTISANYDSSKTRPYDVYKFNPEGMDQGLSGDEFVNIVIDSDPVFQRKELQHGYLMHHGVKGQKWGQRRYQNSDGTWTEEGKARRRTSDRERRNIIRNKPYTDDINNIVNTLSDYEKELLGADPNKDWIDKKYHNDTLKEKAVSFVTKNGDIPVSFVEVWTNGGRVGQISLATRNDHEYRGKGYASKDVERAINWCDRYGKKSIDELEWIADRRNAASIAIGKKYGFVEDDPNKHGHDWKDDFSEEYAIMYRPVGKKKKN